ncbi:MAG: hypothetical protein UX11_C0019G0008 [Candidatus Collierbacteria bacterium GW2011_GWC2_45_40]|nr:MAG: hypothetical protein UX11_C0019G0008 [Candidatus Collierbacteria bacterium GW2011_GWC2_45_40]
MELKSRTAREVIQIFLNKYSNKRNEDRMVRRKPRIRAILKMTMGELVTRRKGRVKTAEVRKRSE